MFNSPEATYETVKISEKLQRQFLKSYFQIICFLNFCLLSDYFNIYQNVKQYYLTLLSHFFLGILFTCFCVTTTKRTVKKCFPDDVAQQNLIVSNTEGPGEEVTVIQN